MSPGIVDSYVSGGETVYCYRETSRISGWNVIVLFDSDEINGNVYRTFGQQLIALACLAALAFIFGINILKYESAGLNELCGCTEEIAAGNLNYRVKEGDLQQVMEDYGAVSSVKVVMDRETGKSKGFAFIEMEDDAAAAKAIAELNGAEYMGRTMVVKEARPRA